MDFYKERCKDLCQKIANEGLKTTKELDKFVKDACDRYKSKDDHTTLEKEKKLLGFKNNLEDRTLLYGAFGSKSNKYLNIPDDYNSKEITKTLESNSMITEEDVEVAEKYVTKFLVKLREALRALGKRTNVKFFSIFLGVGTGTHYRQAAAEIEKKRQKLELQVEQLRKKLEQQKLEEQSKKKPEHDPGVFQGLPNGEKYCYLNTALQVLFASTKFRDKVLNADISPKARNLTSDNFKELRATQFFSSI